MGTVTRSFKILSCFTQARPEIGLSDLARCAGLSKTTAHRMLTELAEVGLVEQTTSSRAYRLGPEVLRLASRREAAVPLLSVARDMVTALAQQLNETAHVSLLRGSTLTLLTHAYSARHSMRVMMEDTEVLPFHASSSGLAVLAFSAAELTDQALTPPLRAYTAQTLTDPARLRALLERIRMSGSSRLLGGLEANVVSIAAPFFGPDAQPIGALAVAAPSARITAASGARIDMAVKLAACDMTHKTGGTLPARFPNPQNTLQPDEMIP